MAITINGTTRVSAVASGATINTPTISGGTLSSPTINTATIATPTITNATITSATTAAPAFSAYLGSTQSITTNTWTKVTLSSELFDTAIAFDSSTNYRFTPQVAGYYQISAGIRIEGVNASNKSLAIYKNGSQLYSADTYTPSSVTYNPSYLPVTISATIYLNGSTDYIELYGYSNGTSTGFGGGGGGTNTAPWQTYMTGFLARSA